MNVVEVVGEDSRSPKGAQCSISERRTQLKPHHECVELVFSLQFHRSQKKGFYHQSLT